MKHQWGTPVTQGYQVSTLFGWPKTSFPEKAEAVFITIRFAFGISFEHEETL